MQHSATQLHAAPQPAPGTLPTNAASVAAWAGGRCEGDPTCPIHALANFEDAREGQLTFIRSEGLARRWGTCGASAALISSPWVQTARSSEGADARAGTRALVIVEDADRALSAVLAALAPRGPARSDGAHPSSVIAADAQVAPGASVGPLCVVESGARIGAGAVLTAQCFVGAGASIGPGSLLHPGVRVLERCIVGGGCILHAGVVIGADGFGYRPRPDGRGLAKIPHIGIVRLGDDVEVGANSCIDRAKFGETRVGDGTKIDNLVQIGHNCVIGRCCVICGNVGLAGSVRLGDGVILGGGVGVADNVTIGPMAKIAAASGVHTDLPGNAEYMGMPAMPVRDARRAIVAFKRLGQDRTRPPGGGRP